MNKKWSSLNDERKTGGLKRGHFGEYFTEMQFMLHGFEVYKTLVDDRGVDLIARNQNGIFFDIQVKSITDYDNIKISRNKFDTKNEHLLLVAVQFFDNKEPEMFIFPSKEWAKSDNIFYDSTENVKEPQYGLRLLKSNINFFKEYEFEKYIEVIKKIDK